MTIIAVLRRAGAILAMVALALGATPAQAQLSALTPAGLTEISPTPRPRLPERPTPT